jgi:hypothetical protein
MDLAELLQWVTLGRKTGSLTFVRNKTKNYIFFKDGKIISSKSNEPTKQLGHYLLFEGKITEVQLKKALEIQLQSRANLGKILVQEGYITKVEAEKALLGRTEEVIYDLFLWEEGYFGSASISTPLSSKGCAARMSGRASAASSPAMMSCLRSGRARI